MPLSTAAKNSIMDMLTGRSYSFGGTMYIGLSLTEPTASGEGITEPWPTSSWDSGYERILVGTHGSSATYKMSPASNGTTKNTTAILFPRAKQNWGTVGWVVFYTQATGGTFLGWAPLTTKREVNADYVANFDKESISLSLIDA